MRVLKMAGLAAVTMSIIASCDSTKKVAESSTKESAKVAVPVGVNTVVNISKKKAKLTKSEEDNWQHLDLATDTIPGMSVNKAYDFLKGKKSVEVVVGVVDSGTDLKHEDLKDVAWVNIDEIPGNGKDDDKNGYIDDINGWNFLGDAHKEHLEYERILMKPSIASNTELAEVKAYSETKVNEAKTNKQRYGSILADVTKASDIIAKKVGKENFTFEDIKKIDVNTSELKTAVAIAERMKGYGLSLPQAKKELGGLVEKAETILSGDNLKTDYRKTGDDAYNFNDKPGYGNGKTGHSEKDEAHGSHVSGIVGATRNNGKGMNGVADNVKIMAVRSVPDGDEYDKDVALGIRYAVDNGAKVINTSFGKTFSPKKQWVYDAIKYAADNDVLIVNAAGNSHKNIDVEKTFPNDAPDLVSEVANNFLTVGASTYKYDENLPATFTNYGKKNVDVFSPGYQIHSTTPENEYKKFNGTSMASPNVAGVAALIRSYYPKLTAAQVKQIIMNSGTQVPFNVIKPGSQSALNPKGELVPFSELSVSGRIVNAYNALKMADKMVNGK